MNLVRWGSTQMKCDLWCHVAKEGSNIQCHHLNFLPSNMLLPWVSLNNHLHLDLLSDFLIHWPIELENFKFPMDSAITSLFLIVSR
ncbi:hypothetical protein PVAP13_2KG192500 [Panicum virgatum]|uniref:Uncharacterized protein n=1 Tax=Panicum virgatum TaxID=38727 RepID=A0A8T0W025_PANVG|nr:hypothetical protein PVAP13_2KG192500 [Panicum virgatum]